jgi:hypothetical protein
VKYSLRPQRSSPDNKRRNQGREEKTMLPLKRHYRSSRPFSSADAAAPPRHVAPPV